MGLFGFGKPKKDAQVSWLEKVDLAYQKAFQVKNATGLAEYLTRPCLSKMMERIRMGDKAYSGLARYQHTNWVKGRVSPECIEYTKEVTYDNIKMSHGIVVPVGDESKEIWSIVKENGVDKVSDIRRV